MGQRNGEVSGHHSSTSESQVISADIIRYPPLTPFEHYDHGKDADPSFPDLLPQGKVQVDNLTPTIGSEVRGVQLSQLTKEGKDQLALFVAQRKVVGT